MRPGDRLTERRTVLLVEDALTTRCILEQFFTRAGCDVLQAADPDTAFLRLKTSEVDAVILDLRLGKRSGLEVLEQIRLEERYADLPVIILTGVLQVLPEEDEIIKTHRAHLLYKHLGYKEVVGRLEQIIKAKAAA